MIYFFLAYAVIWVGLLAFVMSISSRQKQLAAELALMESLLDEASPSPKGPPAR